jgi:hypothetical protein
MFSRFFLTSRSNNKIASVQTEYMARMPNRTGNEPADRPIARRSGFALEIAHLEAFQFAPASSVGPERLSGHPTLLPVQGMRAPNAGVGKLMSAPSLSD